MHVAVQSMIVQMSTQFMLQVVMVQQKIKSVLTKTVVVLQKMKLACAGRWRLSKMALDSEILSCEDRKSVV